MFRIEIVGVFDPQVLELSDMDTQKLMRERTRIHSRSPGFVSALRGYGEFINQAIKDTNLYIDDPEVKAYFEICRVFHAGGAVVFHNV
tara:strand:- start:17411 stop:17674 length:264 start_codon:yes stop_codon:yes gene_type:complete